MVVVDLLIDPIAVHGLEIWEWDSEGIYYDIPFHNFLGWFFLSIPLISLFSFFEYKINKISQIISSSILTFFVIIGLINEIFLASLIGIIIIVFNTTLSYRRNKKNQLI